MTTRLLLAATLLALTTTNGISSSASARSVSAAPAPAPAPIATILDPDPARVPPPPLAWQADDPADSLYRQAREALNRGAYRDAAAAFARIVERYPQSTYAGDALYWEAFAQYSIGERRSYQAALSALEAQKARYPRAATRGDADALTVRVRGALAQLGDEASAQAVTTRATESKPCRDGEEDDDSPRMAALSALLQMNAEQAMPILRQVLARRDACSAKLREKAVFLASQKRTPETEDILLDVVRNDPSREVRKQAVFWLGQVNTDRAVDALVKLLTSSADEELREQAVFALMQQKSERGQAAVRAVAEDDKAPSSLREQAVFQLGQRRSTANAAYLRNLFNRLASASGERNEELQQKILFSLSQMRGEGNDRWLMEVAANPRYSVETRKQAIFGAGQIRVPIAELVALYDKASDREIKEQLIWVMSDRRDPAAVDRLIEIAKHDKDPEMRKKAIFWLGQSRDPRVKQLLLDIINGE
jgi:HEAT repeat protein